MPIARMKETESKYSHILDISRCCGLRAIRLSWLCMTKSVKQWRQEMEDYVEQFGGYPETGEGQRFDWLKIGRNGGIAYCQWVDNWLKERRI